MFTSTARAQVVQALEDDGFDNMNKTYARVIRLVRKQGSPKGFTSGLPKTSNKGHFRSYADVRKNGKRVKIEVTANSPLFAEEARGIIQDLTETYPIIADNKYVIAVWLEEFEEKPFIPRQPRMPNPRHNTKATRRS